MTGALSPMGTTCNSSEVGDMGRNVAGTVLGLFTSFIGLVAVVTGWQLGYSVTAEGLGIGLFPFIIGLCLVLSGLYQVYSAKSGRETIELISRRQAWRVGGIYGSLIGYVVLTQFLGYLVATIVFLSAESWLLGARGWLKIWSVAVMAALAFFWVFQIWMQMPLPRGVLESLGVL